MWVCLMMDVPFDTVVDGDNALKLRISHLQTDLLMNPFLEKTLGFAWIFHCLYPSCSMYGIVTYI